MKYRKQFKSVSENYASNYAKNNGYSCDTLGDYIHALDSSWASASIIEHNAGVYSFDKGRRVIMLVSITSFLGLQQGSSSQEERILVTEVGRYSSVFWTYDS